MSEALRTHVKPDITKLEHALNLSDSIVTTEKTRLDRQYEIQHKMEHDLCLKIEELFDKNSHKVCAKSWERCTTAMKAKLLSRNAFDSETQNDPIMIIKVIKKHSLCFEESRYEMATIYDAIRNFINCKQKEKENFLEHARRFKI